MSESPTFKNKHLEDTITIPHSPFFNIVGHGTGVHVEFKTPFSLPSTQFLNRFRRGTGASVDSKTHIKNKGPFSNNKLTLPTSPFLNRLGYGTGVIAMQLVRSRHAGVNCPHCPGYIRVKSLKESQMVLEELSQQYQQMSKRVEENSLFERTKAESDLLKRMSHPNIVAFCGFSRGRVLYSGVACDLKLGDMIMKRIEETSKPFLPKQILKVAVDIASALDYLHTKMQVLHGDIKCYNIFVNGDFLICKLSDFGVSLPLDENGVVDKSKAGKANYVGADKWRAPEVMYRREITSKTDIWALGISLWEMMALSPPHLKFREDWPEEDEDKLDTSLYDLGDSLDNLIDLFRDIYGTRPLLPPALPAKQYWHALSLFHGCTHSRPQRRPSARHVLQAARDMLQHCETTEISRYFDALTLERVHLTNKNTDPLGTELISNRE